MAPGLKSIQNKTENCQRHIRLFHRGSQGTISATSQGPCKLQALACCHYLALGGSAGLAASPASIPAPALPCTLAAFSPAAPVPSTASNPQPAVEDTKLFQQMMTSDSSFLLICSLLSKQQDSADSHAVKRGCASYPAAIRRRTPDAGLPARINGYQASERASSSS